MIHHFPCFMYLTFPSLEFFWPPLSPLAAGSTEHRACWIFTFSRITKIFLSLLLNSGYMAPEYAMEGLYSTKSDVFSFGVILLEIITGRKNSGFHKSKRAPSLLAYVSFFGIEYT